MRQDNMSISKGDKERWNIEIVNQKIADYLINCSYKSPNGDIEICIAYLSHMFSHAAQSSHS